MPVLRIGVGDWVRRSVATSACAAAIAALAAASVPSAGASAVRVPAPPHRPVLGEPARAGSYVALGDSFTSGPGIRRQVSGTCGRSDRNYPSLVAGAISASSFTDVSCGGAVTADMTGPQAGSVRPQLEALTAGTTLVTLGIGGNDIGFGEIASTCGSLGSSGPGGSPCADHFTRDGRDRIADRIAALSGDLEAVLAEIRDRSPTARILVVGYPRILPETGSCYGQNVPIAPGDYPYLAAKTRELNAVLAAAASAAGAEFVDTYGPSQGHDVYQPPGRRWIEGFTPASAAAAIHPNALGMRGSADAVLAAFVAR